MWGIGIRNLVSGAMLAGVSSATLAAASISGTFNIAGTITATQNTITWQLNDSPFPADLARIGPGATGSFIGLNGTTISIADLSRVTEPVGPPGFTDQPFIAFTAGPLLGVLDINFIYQGLYTPAACLTLPATVGQQCTVGPPASPFSFTNNNPAPPAGPQATATFVFTGETADHLSTWTGNFSSQFFVSYQTVLAGLSTTGSVTNTFSATFTATPINQATNTPEPGPAVLTACGLGLVLFSVGLRRRSGRC